MKDIYIIGHGGQAKELAQYIRDINGDLPQWNLVGFTTADPSYIGVMVGQDEICILDRDLLKMEGTLNVIIGIGFPQIIARLAKQFAATENISYPNLIHPKAYMAIGRDDLGRGNIVAPGVIISVDVKLGSHNLINWNVTLGHDTKLGDYNVLNSGSNISGAIRIGNRVLIGTGAQILQGLTICDDAIIGAGAVVTKDISVPGTYVGIPARLVPPKMPLD
jgi:sugar O-acyltransferase (sialic acid O-acetyltransferase NeuD family)